MEQHDHDHDHNHQGEQHGTSSVEGGLVMLPMASSRARPVRAPIAGPLPVGLLTIDVPVEGVCCAEEAEQIEDALFALSGVRDVRTLVAAERTTVSFDPEVVSKAQITAAIRGAGFGVRDASDGPEAATKKRGLGEIIGWGVLGFVAVVVLAAIAGERLGMFDDALSRVPWWLPALAILVGGWRVFLGVARAARQRKVTGHTLMTVGTIAAVVSGQWATAALLVFFMRFSTGSKISPLDAAARRFGDWSPSSPPRHAFCATGVRLRFRSPKLYSAKSW